MKKLMLCILMATSIAMAAQTIVPTLSGSIQLPFNKSQIHGRALEWLSLKCETSTHVIHIKESNQPTGKMILKGFGQVSPCPPMLTSGFKFKFNLILEAKEGYLFYQLRDIVVIDLFCEPLKPCEIAALECSNQRFVNDLVDWMGKY